jgi:hypothetical protein
VKTRLRALALAVAALLLFYGLAFSDSSTRTEDTRPLSNEPGAAGYSALRDWFAGAGVRWLSLRDDYGTLDALTEDHPTGNLLVVTGCISGSGAGILCWCSRPSATRRSGRRSGRHAA